MISGVGLGGSRPYFLSRFLLTAQFAQRLHTLLHVVLADQGVTYLESKRNNCHSYSYLFKQTGEVIIIKLSIIPHT